MTYMRRDGAKQNSMPIYNNFIVHFILRETSGFGHNIILQYIVECIL